MPAECKIVDCCDLDDFPLSSSGEGNCPVGWQWDGVSCVRCAIPVAPSLTLGGGTIEVEFTVAEGLLYRLERFEGGHWMTLSDGTGEGIGVIYPDDTVEVGMQYSYRITVAVGAECGYIEGESASAVAV